MSAVSMKRKAYVLSLMMMPGFAVQAATCEANFQTGGDAQSGLTFTGSVEKLGLGINSALGQLQKFAADEKFEIGSITMLSGDKGQVAFVQTANNPPVVVMATADSSGTVLLGTKLAPGQKMAPDAARGHICGMLNKLKTGPEGEAIAAQGGGFRERGACREGDDGCAKGRTRRFWTRHRR